MAELTSDNAIKEKYPIAWEHLELRCLPMPEDERKPVYDFFKRAFDIVASLCAIILFWWIIAIAVIAIKIEDGGPAIYTQTRVGKNGRLFKLYKLRSMCVDAEKKKKELIAQNEMDGPAFKMKYDPRVTRVGAFLRKTSIDELPQLFNILKGDMSVVGPRPPLGHEVMQYDEYAMRRLTVKPGLTCYWQCSGRNNIEFDEWMRLDNQYIDDRSFWKDISIIFKTIPAVLKGDGSR